MEDQIIEYEKDFSALFSTSTPQETKTRAAQIYLTYAIGKLADPPGISDSTDASPFFQFFPSLDVVVEATYNSLLLDPEIENNYLEPYFGAQSSGVHFPIIAPLIKQVLEYAKRLRYGRLKESALIEPILSALPKKQTEKIEIKIV